MNFPITTASLHTLNPNLDTIFDPIQDSEVVSVQIWVETGSQHESALAGSGISHLLEHMVFKGTDRFPGDELSQVVQAAGGQWNAYTTFDRTVYYIDGPAESLQLFLSALIEMAFRPTFPEDEFEKEKEVIRREIAMYQDSPDSVNFELLYRTAYQRDNRRHPIIGHLDLFNAITHEQMKTYHDARYQPANSFLVISGGFDPAEARTHIEEELAKGIRPPASFPIVAPTEPRQLGTRRASAPFKIPTTQLSMSWQVGGLDHEDNPALQLLSAILGGGRSTPLYRHLREEKGLVHSIGTYVWDPLDGPGMFNIYADLAPENTETVEQAILAEIHALAGSDLTKPLARAFRQIASQQFKTLVTASGRASDLASNWHQARDLNFTKTALEALEKVTEGDLRRVHAKYLIPEKLTVTTLVPEDFQSPKTTASEATEKGPLVEHTLSNGLRVVLQNDPTIPVVYTQTSLLAGCLSETPATAGLNTILTKLLLKGTAKRDALEIAETMEDLGASIGASAGNNTMGIGSYCLKDDFATIADLLGDILANPTFPTDAIDREKAAHIAGLEESAEDPATRAFRTMRAELFQNQGYGVHPSGTVASVSSLDRVTISAQHSRYFVASNMVTAVFGDLDPHETIEILESTLGKLPTGTPADLSQAPQFAAGEHTITLDKEQGVLAIGFPGLAQDDPRRSALELIDAHCSDMAGPLFTRIREELGLAYYVATSTFFGLNTGNATFYLGTSPDQLEFAQRELQGEIDKLIEEGIPADVLDRVKANNAASNALRDQSPAARAQMVALDVLLGDPAHHHLTRTDRLNAVTEKEIHTLAKDLFQPQKALTVTVSPTTQTP